MTDIQLRPARPPEASAISDLAMRSKAHWGYDDDFLNACRTELTVAPDRCDGVRLIVAESEGVIIGFYRLSGEAPEGTLEALFVDEPMIGSGLGRRLFADAVDRAQRLGLVILLIDADLGAVLSTSTWARSESANRLAGRSTIGYYRDCVLRCDDGSLSTCRSR